MKKTGSPSSNPKEQERKVHLTRHTGETDIDLELHLDGEGRIEVNTGFGLLDHMLVLLAFWARFDLKLTCKGDLHIDAHHTVEDVGLLLGHALEKTLGDRKGIQRCGWAMVPMDEALAQVAVDFSGRPWLEWHGEDLLPPLMAGEEKDIWREFYKAVASTARCNIHIVFQYGKNGHHLLESAAKGLGMALNQAVQCTRTGVPSTKGSLD